MITFLKELKILLPNLDVLKFNKPKIKVGFSN